LTQARATLNRWAFKRQVALERFYQQASYYGWQARVGHRWKQTITCFRALRKPLVCIHFKADSARWLALVSMVYDVLNQLSIDAEIAPYSHREKDLLLLHLEKGDLLLLDRGYPCLG
jgi:hypothetical protein